MTPAPNRRWSFSLRTLFILMTVAAIMSGSFAAFPVETAVFLIIITIMLFWIWCTESVAHAVANLIDRCGRRRGKKRRLPSTAPHSSKFPD